MGNELLPDCVDNVPVVLVLSLDRVEIFGEIVAVLFRNLPPIRKPLFERLMVGFSQGSCVVLDFLF